MSIKVYSEYKDSGIKFIGLVPCHWKVEKLKHCAEVFPSNVDKKSVEGQLQTKLCNYTDVYYNEIIHGDMDFMSATATKEQVKKFQLLSGDVVFTKDSETADDIGIAALVPKSLSNVIYGYHLSIARPSIRSVGSFLKRFFDSSETKAYFQVMANGLTRVGLGQYSVDNTPIALPPRQEQTQIARFLDFETARIDTLIAEQQRLIELLKEKRQAVISHAVTKGLDPTVPMKDSGVEWLGEVPAHWVVSKFGHISSVVRGGSPRPAGDPELFNGDYSPWVTVAEITKNDEIYLDETETFLTKKGSEQCRVFTKGTLIISNSGATLGVPKLLNISANANDGVVGFESLQLDPVYSYFYLSTLTNNLRERIKQGSGQPNLNTDIVKSIYVPIPPRKEISKIIEAVNNIREQFKLLSEDALAGNQLLQERRAALISAAITGKIDVRNWQPPTDNPKVKSQSEAMHG